MSFPRYPKYKDSGVEWLGEVPEGWEVIRIANLFSDTAEHGSDDLPILSVSIHHGVSDNEIPEEEMDRTVARSDDRSKYKKVQPGDLVYNMMRAWQGGFGSVSVPGMVSPAYVVARPRREFETIIIEQQLRTPPAIEQMRRHSRGVTDFRLRLYWDEFKNIRVVLPSVAEQTAIAAFLDRETAKIDALVAEQRRLMDLLNEQIISLVLSSFSDPDTVELRLSEASLIISRPVTQKADETYTRIGLFNRGRGLFHKDASEMDDMGESDFFWIEENDLIISGQFAWEGAVALADVKDTGCVVSHRYPVLRGKSGVALTEYLLGLLCTKHGDFLLNENSRGAAGRNRPLNISSLMKEKIPVPNLEVQKAVARAVHARKTLFKEIANAIALLQERRAALISAAVTGQIDVRTLEPAPSA